MRSTNDLPPTINRQFAPLAAAFNLAATEIHNLAKAKGWHDDPETDADHIKRAVCNLHGEVSELWESFRNGELHRPCDKADAMIAAKLPALTCLEEELADIIIRALDNAKRLGVDIGRAVAVKHTFNATRSRRHGGKLA